ncbi:MAG: response regulator [Pseudonocardia sp.]|nr:response regulator [Pseudonocardia sp.]
MTTVTALLQGIGAVLWPIVVLVVVLIFRKPIVGLLTQATSFAIKAPGGFELSAVKTQAADALVEASATKNPGAPITHAEAYDKASAMAQTVQQAVRTPRILWVDDNPANNANERLAMQRLGMVVVTSTSTADALDRIGAEHYDVVISDMARGLQRRAGFTLFEKLRAAGRDLPYIVYAGSVRPADVEEAKKLGIRGYTNRPGELIDLVVGVLRG